MVPRKDSTWSQKLQKVKYVALDIISGFTRLNFFFWTVLIIGEDWTFTIFIPRSVLKKKMKIYLKKLNKTYSILQLPYESFGRF